MNYVSLARSPRPNKLLGRRQRMKKAKKTRQMGKSMNQNTNRKKKCIFSFSFVNQDHTLKVPLSFNAV